MAGGARQVRRRLVLGCARPERAVPGDEGGGAGEGALPRRLVQRLPASDLVADNRVSLGIVEWVGW